MGATIDERVVEMRFDNKQFEANAGQSLSTLQKLKEALNFSSSKNALSGLDKAAKATSLDGLQAGVDALTKRFSTMGIIGMRVVENLTDSVMHKLGGAISAVTSQIKSGGLRRAMNLEQAHFQLQSIIGDEERVQEVMSAANKSVDGTAYSFDVAAKAASQFYASGVTDMNSMDEALRGLVGTTATFSADYGQMSMIWTQVAGQGRLMGDQLLQLSTRGANAAVEIAKFVNGVNDGSIEVSDSVRNAVRAISKSTNNTEADIRDFVSKGKVNFDVFAAAMNHAFGDSAQKANETFTGALSNIKSALARIGAGFVSPLIAQNSEIVRMFNSVRLKINDVKSALVFDEQIGNVNALSKQVTDFVLNMAGWTADFIDNLDLTKPLEAFYYGVESVKNVLKGLWTIISPIGRAIRYYLFEGFTGQTLVDFAKKLKDVTSGFKLVGKDANNFRATMNGIFSLIRLVGEAVVKLIGLFIPLGEPITSLGSGILQLTGFIGKNLSQFSRWVRTSKGVKKAYDTVRDGIQGAMSTVSGFIKKVSEAEIIETILEGIGSGLNYIWEKTSPVIIKINDLLVELRDHIIEMVPAYAEKKWNEFLDFLKKLKGMLPKVDFEPITKGFNSFKDKIKEFFSIVMDSEGIDEFTSNMKDFFSEMRDGFQDNTLFTKIKDFFALFTFDNIIDGFEKLKKTVGGVIDWFKTNVLPAFDDVSAGGLVAVAGGVAIIYTLVKAVKPLADVIKGIKDLPTKVLGPIKDVLLEYQRNLKASEFFKIAAAISLLATTLILLSFADWKRVLAAAAILSLISAAFLYGTAKLLEAAKKGKSGMDAVYQLSKGLSKSISNLGKAVKWKAISGALKSFGIAIAAITGSIIVLALMYKKDSGSVNSALLVVGSVVAVLMGVIAIFSKFGDKMKQGVRNFQDASSGILSLSLAVGVAVLALGTIFKMDIPNDWGARLALLGGIFVAIGALALIVGGASKVAGGGKLKATGTILALSVMLMASVKALQTIFSMDLPKDYKTKMTMLMSMFGALELLLIAIGGATRIAGGQMKATGTILSMCLFIASAVGALMLLSLIPGEKLISGAIAIGIVLSTLAVSLAGAGKVVDKSAGSSILAMAITIGSITLALGVLSMVSWEKLLKAAGSLGAVLFILSKDLNAAANASKKGSWAAITVMTGALLVIAGSLVILASQPWENMLASGAAMSAVLLMFEETIKRVSKSSGLKKEKIGAFLLATTSMIPIALSLAVLANQPWQGMLASGVAMGAVLLAFAVTMKTISALRGINNGKIASFILATVALLPIAASLKILAGESWSSILPGMVSLNATALVLTGLLYLLSKSPVSVIGALALVAGAIALLPIAASLKILAGESWSSILPGMVSLNATALVLAGLLVLLGTMPISVVGAIALAAGAVALIPIAGAMKILSGLSWKDVATGLVTLAGALAIIGVAGVVIGPISPLLLALSAALIAFGAAIAVVGVGLVTFTASLLVSLNLLGQMMDTLNAGVSAFIGIGRNVMAGFGGGLLSGVKGVLSIVSGIGKSVISTVAGVLGIHSPSVVMKALGINTDEGFALGIESGEGTINNSITKVFGGITDKINLSALTGKGEEGSENFAAGLLNGEGDISSVLSLLMGDANSNLDLTSFFGTGEEGVGQLMLGLSSGSGDMSSMFGSMLGDANSSVDLTSFFNTGQEGGTNFLSGFQNGTSAGAVGPMAADIVSRLNAALTASINVKDFGSLGRSVMTAITNSIKNSSGGINSQIRTVFRTGGAAGTSAWITAITSSYPKVTATGKEFANRMLSAIRAMLPTFTNMGKQAANNFLNGLRSTSSSASSAARAIANAALNGMRGVNFTSAGVDAAQGFINGIRSKQSSAASAGSAIGNAAYNAARKALAEKSPSKKMYEVGDYAGVGFVNGLLPYVKKASMAGENVGNASVKALGVAVSAMSDIIDENFDTSPVIRPIVDLNGVEKSAQELNALFNETIAMQAQSAQWTSSAVANAKKSTINQAGANGYGKNEYHYSMYQTNNSPKALSRIDIYRDTTNLFTQFREAVEQK